MLVVKYEQVDIAGRKSVARLQVDSFGYVNSKKRLVFLLSRVNLIQ